MLYILSILNFPVLIFAPFLTEILDLTLSLSKPEFLSLFLKWEIFIFKSLYKHRLSQITIPLLMI